MSRKRKNQRNKKSKLPIIFILVIALIGAGYMTDMFTIGRGGFSVSSITTNPNIITEDTDLEQARFLVLASFTGAGQSIVGMIEEDDFKSMSGYETDYPLTISAESVNEYLEYEIDNSFPQSINMYTITDYEHSGECPPGTKYDIVDYMYACGFHFCHICIDEQPVAIKANFESPEMNFDVPIEVCVYSECDTKTIGNVDEDDVTYSADFYDDSGNWVTQVSWDGSLVTGKSKPNQDNYVAILRDDAPVWKSVNKDKYISYTQKQSAMHTTLEQYTIDPPIPVNRKLIEAAIDDPNSAAEILLLDKDNIGGYSNYNIIDDEKYRINMGDELGWRQWQNPLMTFKVKASWIGVVIPVGKPDITSISDVTVISGTPATLYVDVKNIGSGQGTFYPTLGSGCPLTLVDYTPVTLQPQSTATMQVKLSTGTVSQNECGQCDLKVYDINKPSNYDTASFDYCTEVAQKCSPVDSYKPIGNCLYYCPLDGQSHWEENQMFCCELGKEVLTQGSDPEYDGWYCKATGTEPPDDKDCYVACVDEEQCGYLPSTNKFTCEVTCQIKCLILDNIWYVAAGVLGLFMLVYLFRGTIHIGGRGKGGNGSSPTVVNIHYPTTPPKKK